MSILDVLDDLYEESYYWDTFVLLPFLYGGCGASALPL